MQRITLDEGRGTSPGLRLTPADERGSVTVEAAGALAIICIVFAMVMQMLGFVHARLALQSVAREASRIAAIQVDDASAMQAAGDFVHRASPENRLRLTGAGAYVTATVERTLHAPLWPTGIEIEASATALREGL